MNQNSPKFLITLAVILSLTVTSAAGFLMFKDKKIDFDTKNLFNKIFNLFSAKQNKQNEQITKKPKNLSTPESTSKVIEERAKGNLTENLSQNLAAIALLSGLDANIIEKNPEIIDRAIDEAGINSETVCASSQISDDEIIISEDNSEKAIKNYLTSLIDILEKYASRKKFTEPEIKIMQEAMSSKDFSELNKYHKSYQDIIKALKKLSVPSSWKDVHKESINIFILIDNIYQGIEQTNDDPLKAMICLNKYQTIPELFDDLALNIATLAEHQKQTFDTQ